MLHPIVAKEIKKNRKLKGLLASTFEVTGQTIENWLKGERNHLMLTTPKAVAIISEELSLTESEILTEEVRA